MGYREIGVDERRIPSGTRVWREFLGTCMREEAASDLFVERSKVEIAPTEPIGDEVESGNVMSTFGRQEACCRIPVLEVMEWWSVVFIYTLSGTTAESFLQTFKLTAL